MDLYSRLKAMVLQLRELQAPISMAVVLVGGTALVAVAARPSPSSFMLMTLPTLPSPIFTFKTRPSKLSASTAPMD